MSAVEDILRSAIEQSAKARMQHLADVQEKCEAANENLHRSRWEHRLEVLRGAAQFVKELSEDKGEKTEP